MNFSLLHDGISSGTFLGAFAGSVVFVFSSSDYGVLRRILLFTVSIIMGINSAAFAASLTTSLLGMVLNEAIHTPEPVGATISSALAVKVLMHFSGKVGNVVLKYNGGDKK